MLYFAHGTLRIRNVPSRIAFEIGMFPDNIPLPEPRTSAWLLGGTMHFLHLIVRISQVRKVPDADAGWEDMYRESEGSSWFDWVRHASHPLATSAHSSLDNPRVSPNHNRLGAQRAVSLYPS